MTRARNLSHLLLLSLISAGAASCVGDPGDPDLDDVVFPDPDGKADELLTELTVGVPSPIAASAGARDIRPFTLTVRLARARHYVVTVDAPVDRTTGQAVRFAAVAVGADQRLRDVRDDMTHRWRVYSDRKIARLYVGAHQETTLYFWVSSTDPGTITVERLEEVEPLTTADTRALMIPLGDAVFVGEELRVIPRYANLEWDSECDPDAGCSLPTPSSNLQLTGPTPVFGPMPNAFTACHIDLDGLDGIDWSRERCMTAPRDAFTADGRTLRYLPPPYAAVGETLEAPWAAGYLDELSRVEIVPTAYTTLDVVENGRYRNDGLVMLVVGVFLP